MTAVRTAFTRHSDAATAIADCASQIGAPSPDLLIAFVGGKHDPAATLAALRRHFGAIPIVGGSAAGVIAREGTGYGGLEINLIAFTGADIVPRWIVTHAMLSGEREAGLELGKATRDVAADDQCVLLLFDSIVEPLRLHPASLLVDGFTEGLAGRTPHIIGGGLLSDLNLTDAWVLDGETVCKHAAIALVFPPGIAAVTAILHGCRPVSTFLEITRIEGAEVFELDGEPALTVVERMLGLALGSISGRQLSLVATLGQKQGDPFAPYDERAYVNRLILRADPEAGSITLFEPDFVVGTRVQIMSRDNVLMLESVERGVARLSAEIDGADPLLGLYIDCAGRASVMTGAAVEEADLVLQTLEPAFPFAGFYSGVEIAPFAGYSRPLDWTGVLTILHRKR
jgi:hypothetical protein